MAAQRPVLNPSRFTTCTSMNTVPADENTITPRQGTIRTPRIRSGGWAPRQPANTARPSRAAVTASEIGSVMGARWRPGAGTASVIHSKSSQAQDLGLTSRLHTRGGWLAFTLECRRCDSNDVGGALEREGY